MNPAAVIGIIAEYNPFHKGHQYQLSQVRQKFPDAPVIAVSSGSLTQRGEAPIWDKWKRTRLALLCWSCQWSTASKAPGNLPGVPLPAFRLQA